MQIIIIFVITVSSEAIILQFFFWNQISKLIKEYSLTNHISENSHQRKMLNYILYIYLI